MNHPEVGTTFSRLTIIGPPEARKSTQQRTVYFYPCICACGNKKMVIRSALTSGLTKSCGCLAMENRTKHNKCNTRLYNIWKAMRQRCELPTRTSFEYYGGKGITVCQAWQTFEGFASWAAATGYTDKLTIDRKDSNGNYCPENCQWIAQSENTKKAHLKYVNIECIETGQIFKTSAEVEVMRTDAGVKYADPSTVLKAIKYGVAIFGKHYRLAK